MKERDMLLTRSSSCAAVAAAAGSSKADDILQAVAAAAALVRSVIKLAFELLHDPCAPLTAQLYQMEQLSPTLTSPDTWADGAIQLVLATWGSL
jgi:hypothetical protein